jgi:hypothetical protein
LQTGFKEVNANIKAGVAAVGEKVDAVASKVTSGNGRGKYDDKTIEFCVGVMAAANNNATIKNSLNTRVTHSAVFNYNRSELENRGILDVAEFTRIIRAHQAREQRARQKSAAKLTTKRGENGIMSSMKNRASSTLALTLAIACAVAAPLRSDARSGSCGCGESCQPLAKQAFRGACPQILRGACPQIFALTKDCKRRIERVAPL